MGLRFVCSLSIIQFLLIAGSFAHATTLRVGQGEAYSTISEAASVALPGDTILVRGGIYAGGEFIENLQGERDAWISILAAPGESVVFQGGTEAWHMTDVAWLYINGFEFRKQTGNGLNIDDGGSYETPSHHVVIDECRFHDMDASGNNDLLKLSGLDSFELQDCSFYNGADGGSGVDMVGCHYGLFTSCRFENMGSNAIQAKGGTQFIRIERNAFLFCGQRAINLGGSTGLEFFRPIDAPFEAADLQVYSNVFSGSVAPIAYVGSTRVDVTNNTIWLPEKWVIRILQETVDPDRFISCGDNIFRNNIVVIDKKVSPVVNIGPNTRPQSFLFQSNLWLNIDDGNWQGPNLPVTEEGGLISVDPMLAFPDHYDFSIDPSSPAIGAGTDVEQPERDLRGKAFSVPRSIGAIEGKSSSVSVPDFSSARRENVRVYPNPSTGFCQLRFELPEETAVRVRLIDMRGHVLSIIYDGKMQSGVRLLPLTLPEESGLYGVQVEMDEEMLTTPIIRMRGSNE